MSALIACTWGCAARGPGYAEIMSRADPVGPDEVRLVFFRTHGDWDEYSGYAVPLGVNGHLAGSLAHGGFFFVDVPAGPASLEAPHESPLYPACKILVSVDAGATVYLEVTPRTRFLGAGIAGSTAGIALAGTLTGAVLAGVAGDILASTVESWNEACGGPFQFQPVEEATARYRLENAEWSR